VRVRVRGAMAVKGRRLVAPGVSHLTFLLEVLAPPLGHLEHVDCRLPPNTALRLSSA
jgi:hypothetical protein